MFSSCLKRSGALAAVFLCLAAEAFAGQGLSDQPPGADRLQTAEKKARSIAGWWKYKFKTDPAFSEIPFSYYPRTALRQRSVEEETR